MTNRRLYIKSAFLLWGVRLGLWLLPFRTLRYLLARMRPLYNGSQKADHGSVDRVVQAVSLASRYVPSATCLTQVLTAQALLAQCGRMTHVRIGVAKDEAGKLEAHAWLESEGRIIIGDARDLGRYTLLPSLEIRKQ